MTTPGGGSLGLPEPGRLAMHVLLDALSAFRDEDESMAVVDRAFERLQEVGAITATFDDETDVLDIDASNLLGGMLVLLRAMQTEIAVCRQYDPQEVILALREITDS